MRRDRSSRCSQVCLNDFCPLPCLTLDGFTGIGDFPESLRMEPDLWWDTKDDTMIALATMFQYHRTKVPLSALRDTEFAFRCRFTFFILTVVILMNLLIAMMADTFSKIAANAKAECTPPTTAAVAPTTDAFVTWLCADQMQLAKIIKECYETTVFPVPLNALEHLANHIAGTGAK